MAGVGWKLNASMSPRPGRVGLSERSGLEQGSQTASAMLPTQTA
jgi:hypothetical protein